MILSPTNVSTWAGLVVGRIANPSYAVSGKRRVKELKNGAGSRKARSGTVAIRQQRQMQRRD
jgi:hypothetical protein